MGSDNNHGAGSAAQIRVGSSPKLAYALMKAFRRPLSATFISGSRQMHVMNANECNQRGLIKDGLVQGRMYVHWNNKPLKLCVQK